MSWTYYFPINTKNVLKFSLSSTQQNKLREFILSIQIIYNFFNCSFLFIFLTFLSLYAFPFSSMYNKIDKILEDTFPFIIINMKDQVKNISFFSWKWFSLAIIIINNSKICLKRYI